MALHIDLLATCHPFAAFLLDTDNFTMEEGASMALKTLRAMYREHRCVQRMQGCALGKDAETTILKKLGLGRDGDAVTGIRCAGQDSDRWLL